MTKEEYDRKLAEILSTIPPEFHGFVSVYAWQEGHANGYHEVLNIAEDIVYHLGEAIDDYDTTRG